MTTRTDNIEGSKPQQFFADDKRLDSRIELVINDELTINNDKINTANPPEEQQLEKIELESNFTFKNVPISELLASWNFQEPTLFDESEDQCKIFKGKVPDYGAAMLKIDRRMKHITNEIRVYECLAQKGFKGMPKLLNSTLTENYGALLLSFVDGKQVFDVNSIEELIDYARCLLKGIEYLHSFGVMHGDIKPCNLFVNPNDSEAPIVFIDFAFAHVLEADEKFISLKKAVGYSGGYTSDEVVKTGEVSLADDIYSAGVIIMTLACQADRKDSYYDVDDAWDDFNQDRAPLCNPKLKDLVLAMTGPREKRLTATKLLQHEVFKN